MNEKNQVQNSDHAHCPVLGTASIEKCVCNPANQGLNCQIWRGMVNSTAIHQYKDEIKGAKIKGVS